MVTFYLCLLLVAGASRASEYQSLHRDQIYSGNATDLNLYCYEGRKFSYLAVFATARIEFIAPPESYDLYEGPTVEDVRHEYDTSKPNWLPLVPWHSNLINFPPFEQKCVGIVSTSMYTFKFRSRNIDYSLLLMCVAALMLFFYARKLVHNKGLFYCGGISLGVVASLLAIVFIISRMIPRKKAMIVSLLMGWSFSVYIFHKIWTNIYEVLHEYRTYVMAYVGISAIISFAVCHRWGPPTNERTIDLMQWFVQFIALAIVYHSSHIQEVTLAVCILTLVIYNMPDQWSAKVRTFVRRKLFKPKINLLTEEEFIRQGDEMTRIELEKLRKFAQSPNCDAWKLMNQLKNPQRFSSFVMGESHLDDSEILEYETSDHYNDEITMLTEDESDEDAVDGEVATTRTTRNGNGNVRGPPTER